MDRESVISKFVDSAAELYMPDDVRHELYQCAASNGRISVDYLVAIYRCGRAAGRAAETARADREADNVQFWMMVADGVNHDTRCVHHFACPDVAHASPCLRCEAETARADRDREAAARQEAERDRDTWRLTCWNAEKTLYAEIGRVTDEGDSIIEQKLAEIAGLHAELAALRG